MQIYDKTGQNLSQAVARKTNQKHPILQYQCHLDACFRKLTRNKKMVEVAGVEPASREVSNMASTRLAVLF